MPYWKSLCIALDQLLNALCGGWPDETFSSRCWRWKVAGVRVWPWCVVECLFFWERGHCREAIESERLGRQLPPEARPCA